MLYARNAPAAALPNGHSQPSAASDRERSIPRPVSPDGGWLEVGPKQRTNLVRQTALRESAITHTFGGSLRSILRTPGAKDSVTLEPYQPLQLDIAHESVISVDDALRHISEPETIRLSSAKGEVDAVKQVYVETWPTVLMLHLKRFVFEDGEVVKRSKPVAYGTELIIPPGKFRGVAFLEKADGVEIVAPARRSSAAIKYKLFGGEWFLRSCLSPHMLSSTAPTHVKNIC